MIWTSYPEFQHFLLTHMNLLLMRIFCSSQDFNKSISIKSAFPEAGLGGRYPSRTPKVSRVLKYGLSSDHPIST